jgi:FKBP-type peptidyl-prolyl cis-trans isomerase FklB
MPNLRTTLVTTAVGFALVLPAVFAQDTAPTRISASQSVESEQQKIDYGLGVQMGRNLKNQGIEADPELVIQGLRDALTGKKLAISEVDLRKSMMALRSEMRQSRVRNNALASDENFKAGTAYQAEYKAKPGVAMLPSGLQYRVLQQGKGPKPDDLDVVEVRYRGLLLDGTEFDGSSREEKPAQFVVKSALPGWRQALKLMPVGSKWELVLPPQLAYGERGNGLGVGPQSTVIFELELVAIRAQGAPGKAAAD